MGLGLLQTSLTLGTEISASIHRAELTTIETEPKHYREDSLVTSGDVARRVDATASLLHVAMLLSAILRRRRALLEPRRKPRGHRKADVTTLKRVVVGKQTLQASCERSNSPTHKHASST